MFFFQAIIAYDGTRYLGWQKARTGPSIQETLALAITKATQENSIPEAASRTDRGVHAEGQSVAFSLQKEWDPYRLTKALNAYLPKDIRIQSIERSDSDFHPTLHAYEKEYHYRISLSKYQSPVDRLYAWHFPRPLQLSLMKQAALELIGEKDFCAFANKSEKNPVCTLSTIDFYELERERLQIVMKGDRFLYKMARNISGTLLYIGCGKLDPLCIPPLLASRDRKNGGITAPSHGLFLHRVVYSSDI